VETTFTGAFGPPSGGNLEPAPRARRPNVCDTRTPLCRKPPERAMQGVCQPVFRNRLNRPLRGLFCDLCGAGAIHIWRLARSSLAVSRMADLLPDLLPSLFSDFLLLPLAGCRAPTRARAVPRALFPRANRARLARSGTINSCNECISLPQQETSAACDAGRPVRFLRSEVPRICQNAVRYGV
jgi:hypothetical protein